MREQTGYKDKKGEEVCEGDILEFERGKAYVYYNDKLAVYGLIGNVGFIGNNYEKGEIIGNIHENPELLKGGDKE